MSYFPFFTDISGKLGLIIGGGTVALRKIEKLLPFKPELTVIAPEICGEIRKISSLTLLEREYVPGDKQGKLFVIAAADKHDVNREISKRCQASEIPVNVVDDAELCTFLFPALVQRGELTVGISTGGASPTATVCLKEKIDGLLPENFDRILAYLHSEREHIKKDIKTERERAVILKRLFFACMEAGRALNREETEKICGKEGAE